MRPRLPADAGGRPRGHGWAAMRVRISRPEHLGELVAFLEREVDAVVTPVADDLVEVSLLGSYEPEAMRLELYLRLRAWEAARRSAPVRVEIL